jgi:anaerobic selenocysteine-containing dehydrogenase
MPRLPQILVTDSGKVDLVPDQIAADLPRLLEEIGRSPAEELLLIGRRQLRSANSWLHNVGVLMKGKERCTLQINPDDASRLGVSDGARVAVASATGRVELPAEVTADISRGVVSIPYGWGHGLPGSQIAVASARPGVNSNILTDSRSIDPLSGNAVLNAIPVTVTASD